MPLPVAGVGDAVGEAEGRRVARPAAGRSRPRPRRRTGLPRPRCRHRAPRRRRPSTIISRRSQATVSSARAANSGSPVAAWAEASSSQELGVVVEHLLEVRHEPVGIDRVAGEAAAEMVVDAALADPRQGVQHAVAQGRVAAAPRLLPDQPQDRRLRELGRAGEAAMDRCRSARPAARATCARQLRRAAARRGSGAASRLRASADGLAVAGDALVAAAPELGHLLQHLDEAGPAVARLGREVGAAPERLAVGGQEHGERPAALLAHHRQGLLVDGVEVGPLLAVDLDVDEQPVHHGRRRGVLEALVRHDVAPVAGGVADREQDRPVLGPRQGQRRLVPLAASRPGCPRAAAGRGWWRRRARWAWLGDPRIRLGSGASWPIVGGEQSATASGTAMKVNIEVDCTPDEARRFLGLPDVAPMQQTVMAAMEKRLVDTIQATDSQKLIDQWLPLGHEGHRAVAVVVDAAGRRPPPGCRARRAPSPRNSAGLGGRHDLRPGDGAGTRAGGRAAGQRAAGRGGRRAR